MTVMADTLPDDPGTLKAMLLAERARAERQQRCDRAVTGSERRGVAAPDFRTSRLRLNTEFKRSRPLS
jgi:hypothetical protein